MTGYRFIEETPVAGLERPAEPGLVIGRAPCDVEVTDPLVSRRHAQLRLIDSRLAIEDLGSTNGTFVNGRRVQGVVELAPGDRISLGRTVWHLQGDRANARSRMLEPDTS